MKDIALKTKWPNEWVVIYKCTAQRISGDIPLLIFAINYYRLGIV